MTKKTLEKNDSVVRTGRKLPRSFYERPTLEVAPEILGKYLVHRTPEGTTAAKIVEVEAYIGQDDPACHAARGKTPRNAVMFGPPGVAYIYFIYGMYYCLNFVTEREGFPAAVLIRAAEPVAGVDIMRARYPGKKDHELLSGPGRLCRALGLTRAQNGLDLTGEKLYLEDYAIVVSNIGSSPRVGIKVGAKRHWRFYDKDSRAVSKPR